MSKVQWLSSALLWVGTKKKRFIAAATGGRTNHADTCGMKSQFLYSWRFPLKNVTFFFDGSKPNRGKTRWSLSRLFSFVLYAFWMSISKCRQSNHFHFLSEIKWAKECVEIFVIGRRSIFRWDLTGQQIFRNRHNTRNSIWVERMFEGGAEPWRERDGAFTPPLVLARVAWWTNVFVRLRNVCSLCGLKKPERKFKKNKAFLKCFLVIASWQMTLNGGW